MTATTIEDQTGQEPGAVEEPPADLDVILPEAGPLTIGDIECRVSRLKSRELLALLRVMTAGLGGSLRDVMPEIDTDDPSAMQTEIMVLLVLAIPNAVEEFLQFLRVVVSPVDEKRTADLLKHLDNPDPDVLIEVAAVVVEQEIDDLASLVGKARAALARIQSVYQMKKPTTTG